VFAKLHENIIVKVPLTEQGLKACRLLTEENIRVNVTLCFSANQALMAAKAGAFIISPFIGRLDDIGQTGMELIGEIRQIYDNYGFETLILAASVRHPIHVKEAALAGADVATLPYKVWQQLFHHALTDTGVKTFLEDWAKLEKSKK
jgi:transaldolase